MEQGEKRQTEERAADMRRNIRILVGVILVILLLAFSSVFMKQNQRFAYREHLDDEVVNVEGESVTLRQFGYYVYELESFTQKQALKYHPSDPLDYWNTHFSAGNDSRFVSEIARDTAINRCLSDLVYARMATEAGFALPEGEEQQIHKEASDWYEALPDEAKEVLGISPEEVREVIARNHLAKAYAYEYSKTVDLTGYSGDVTSLLSAGGKYFDEQLLTRYEVKQNRELLEEISFGRITVNKKSVSRGD